MRRIGIISVLVFAGECVFLLPFVLSRIFRPTLLDVFEVTNFQLGSAFSLYGMVAIVSYFAGGPLADRFSARRLMSIALVATAAGGVVMATIPSLTILTLLYGFWGMTTILLFWAALIRSTREWGGKNGQGKAFGILDGGRGLVAALIASVSIAVLGNLLPEDAHLATLAEQTAALSLIIWIFSGIVMVTAALVWWIIPDSSPDDEDVNQSFDWKGARSVVRLPSVWLQAIIVVCAYVGFKSTDDFSLYARDVFGYDDVKAAGIGAISFWVRPFAALAAGLLADRINTSSVVIGGFAIMLAGCLMIAGGLLTPGPAWIMISTFVMVSVGVYSLRGVYFALISESKIRLSYTGSAVGVISVIGFTPDVFMGPVIGYLLDSSPGITGHQHVFAVVALFAALGLIASTILRRHVQMLGQQAR